MANAKGTTKPKPEQTMLLEGLERRRKYPRVVIDAPVTLRLDNAADLTATVHDISIDGLQIRCDRAAAKQIHPSGKFIRAGEGNMVSVGFDLPFKDQSWPVKAACQVYYLAVISETEFAFGLLFREHIGMSAALVDRFIMDQMVPVEDRMRTYLEEPRTHQEISMHMNMQGNEVAEVINRLQVKGEIISFGDSQGLKHLKLSTAIEIIFKTLEQMEKRLTKLE